MVSDEIVTVANLSCVYLVEWQGICRANSDIASLWFACRDLWCSAGFRLGRYDSLCVANVNTRTGYRISTFCGRNNWQSDFLFLRILDNVMCLCVCLSQSGTLPKISLLIIKGRLIYQCLCSSYPRHGYKMGYALNRQWVRSARTRNL